MPKIITDNNQIFVLIDFFILDDNLSYMNLIYKNKITILCKNRDFKGEKWLC